MSGTGRDQYFIDVEEQIQATPSPGFTYGRSGNLPPSTWLLNDTVPCNLSGRINFLNSGSIIKVFIANQQPDILKLAIYTHDGDETNLTFVGSVTTLAQRSNIFAVSFPVPLGKQIAVKIADDSPGAGKNMDVGLQLQGTV